MKYAGLAVGVVFLVKGIAALSDGYHELFDGPALAACTDSDIVPTLEAIAKAQHIVLTSVGHLTAVSRTKTTADCTAEIVASDHSKARLSFRIVFDGKKNSVHVTGAKPL